MMMPLTFVEVINVRANKKAVLYRAVKEAIDSYPGGLCFSAEGGRPILVNKMMNTLINSLTGHTVLNADIMWDEISSLSDKNGCKKLNDSWLDSGQTADSKSNLIFRFPDERIWHFRRQLLNNGNMLTIQTEASEITDLYAVSRELYENNLMLDALRKRQEALLENIVEINREKELLDAKMRIHDELGRCLVAAKKYINTKETSDEEYNRLIKSWSQAISDMHSVPMQGMTTPGGDELDKAAELVGCRITYIGKIPESRRVSLLIYSSIREALTNAVRHGGANEITVNISDSDSSYHVVISNNGKQPLNRITEGGGLRNLRSLLEQEGAELTFRYGNFALDIIIPA